MSCFKFVLKIVSIEKYLSVFIIMMRTIFDGKPRAEKVRLEGSKDEFTKKKNAKDEFFLLICQRTQLFTV